MFSSYTFYRNINNLSINPIEFELRFNTVNKKKCILIKKDDYIEIQCSYKNGQLKINEEFFINGQKITALGVPKNINKQIKRSTHKRLKYKRLGVFDLNFVFEKISPFETVIECDGVEHKVSMKSQRYKVFQKTVKCSCCGIKGKYFALECDMLQFLENPESKCHFNLYGLDKKGREVLMTKDHIIPSSRGGSNKLKNYQTMCQACNVKKGNQI